MFDAEIMELLSRVGKQILRKPEYQVSVCVLCHLNMEPVLREIRQGSQWGREEPVSGHIWNPIPGLFSYLSQYLVLLLLSLSFSPPTLSLFPKLVVFLKSSTVFHTHKMSYVMCKSWPSCFQRHSEHFQATLFCSLQIRSWLRFSFHAVLLLSHYWQIPPCSWERWAQIAAAYVVQSLFSVSSNRNILERMLVGHGLNHKFILEASTLTRDFWPY